MGLTGNGKKEKGEGNKGLVTEQGGANLAGLYGHLLYQCSLFRYLSCV